jgi:uncharacterized repeat protein (TIGR01451 family)
MKRIKKHARALPVVITALLVLGSAATFAQRKFMALHSVRPEVKVVLTGAVERDDARVPVEKAGIVKSGEILDWTIASANDGNAPAHDYKTVGEIPAGTEFIVGSASADGTATVTYSIDHGKSFSVKPMVDERQQDGSVKKVPAPVSMYSLVRFEWVDALDQSGKFVAAYKVRVR